MAASANPLSPSIKSPNSFNSFTAASPAAIQAMQPLRPVQPLQPMQPLSGFGNNSAMPILNQTANAAPNNFDLLGGFSSLSVSGGGAAAASKATSDSVSRQLHLLK
jgi:hypothetical protein